MVACLKACTLLVLLNRKVVFIQTEWSGLLLFKNEDWSVELLEGQMKCFPEKVRLKEFIITKPSLYETLKGLI